MVFSPDGRRLAVACGHRKTGRGGGVRLWDTAGGQEVLTLGNPTDVVTQVAFSPDGLRLVAAKALTAADHPLAGYVAEIIIWEAADPQSTLR